MPDAPAIWAATPRNSLDPFPIYRKKARTGTCQIEKYGAMMDSVRKTLIHNPR